mgnify:CR=1 FL=1
MSEETRERLLTTREVAEWLSVSATTVYRLAAAERIPHVSLLGAGEERLLRFEREAVAAWLAAGRLGEREPARRGCAVVRETKSAGGPISDAAWERIERLTSTRKRVS